MNTKLKKYLPMAGFWIMALTAAAGAAVRVIQMFCAIDYSSGFYKDHYSVLLLNLILLIGLPLAVIAELAAGRPAESARSKPGKGAVTALAAAGVLFGIQAIGKIFCLVFFVINGIAEGYSSFADYIILFLLIACCAAFLLAAAAAEKGRAIGFYIVIPAVYIAAKLILTFMHLTNISNISENLFNVLGLSSAALFLCAFAKKALGLGGRFLHTLLIIFAFCTAVFGIVYLIPNYILSVANMMDIVNLQSFEASVIQINLDELAVAMFSFVFIALYLKAPKACVKENEAADGVDD